MLIIVAHIKYNYGNRALATLNFEEVEEKYNKQNTNYIIAKGMKSLFKPLVIFET